MHQHSWKGLSGHRLMRSAGGEALLTSTVSGASYVKYINHGFASRLYQRFSNHRAHPFHSLLPHTRHPRLLSARLSVPINLRCLLELRNPRFALSPLGRLHRRPVTKVAALRWVVAMPVRVAAPARMMITAATAAEAGRPLLHACK